MPVIVVEMTKVLPDGRMSRQSEETASPMRAARIKAVAEAKGYQVKTWEH